MRKNINIKIAEPCKENWEEMTATQRGAFCNSCERDLYDFTKLTDIELVHFFAKNNTDFCGRYKKSQLNRNITLDTSYSFFRLYKYVVGLFLAFGSFNNLKANPKPEIHFIESTDTIFLESDSLSYSGNIKDADNENIPFANIAAYNKKGEVIYRTSSNLQGNFTLTFPKELETEITNIKISVIGYHSINISSIDFTRTNSIRVNHKFKIESPMILGMISY